LLDVNRADDSLKRPGRRSYLLGHEFQGPPGRQRRRDKISRGAYGAAMAIANNQGGGAIAQNRARACGDFFA
jgi:hypothetical protein